jgi:glutamate 5-kinase
MSKIVIKVGSSTLTYSETKSLNLRHIQHLVFAISDIINRGHQVILVTSGSVAVGKSHLVFDNNLDGIPDSEDELTIAQKQSAAAIGQVELMNIYRELFADYSLKVAQILLTNDITENQNVRTNAKNTIETLMSQNVIPIVNENDTVSTNELCLGDNDTLSAYVAALVEADELLILTDIDGLFDDNPHKNPDAKLIKSVPSITPEIEAIAGGSNSAVGTGGMATKIVAAKIANAAGTPVTILNGGFMQNLYDAVDGKEVGTKIG